MESVSDSSGSVGRGEEVEVNWLTVFKVDTRDDLNLTTSTRCLDCPLSHHLPR